VGFAVVQRAAVCRRVRAADLGNVCAAKQRWTGRMQTYSAATVAEQIRNALRGKKSITENPELPVCFNTL